MQATNILLLLTILLFDSSLLVPFESASKAINTHWAAEQELLKGTQEGITVAIQLLEHAMNDPSFKRLNLEKKKELILSLAKAYQKGRHFTDQETLLKNCIQNSLYHSFRTDLKIHLAQGYLLQGRSQEADEIYSDLQSRLLKDSTQLEKKQITSLAELISRYYEKLITRGELFLEKTDWMHAIGCWHEVLDSVERNVFPTSSSIKMHNDILCHLQYRLGCAYVQTSQWDKASHILSQRTPYLHKGSSVLEKAWYHGLFLQGVSLYKLGKFQEALPLFEDALCPLTPIYSNDCHFFAGICALQCANPKTAKIHLESISLKTISNERKKQISSLLVQVEILDGCYDKAFQLIEAIEAENEKSEAYYLRGKLFYSMKSYEQATVCLEKVLYLAQKSLFDWTDEVYLMLGSAYIARALELENPLAESISFFERSQVYFEELQHHHEEKALFGLAYTFLARHERTGEEIWRQKAIECFRRVSSSEEKQLNALLAIAVLTPSFNVRQEQFATLLKRPLSTNDMLKTTYLKVLDELEYAENNPSYNLEETFAQIKKTTAKEDAVSSSEDVRFVKFKLSKKLLQLHKPNADLALELLQKTATSHKKFYEEALFLTACAQSYKTVTAQDPTPVLALNTIHQLCSLFPNSPYYPYALHLAANVFLATHEEKSAFDLLQTLTWKYPNYSHLDAALFSAAECAEFLHCDSSHIKNFRSMLFSHFPKAPQACLSFFKYFPEQEYFSFNKGAIDHLKSIPEEMTNSCFAIAAFFYIGANYKEKAQRESPALQKEILCESLHTLERASALYYQHSLQETIPPALAQSFSAINFQAQIIQARILAQLAINTNDTILFYEKSEKLLRKLYSEIKAYIREMQPLHKQGSFLEFFYETLQETGYKRAQSLVFLDRLDAAEEQLKEVIDLEELMGIPEHSFTVRAYCELARLFAQKGEFSKTTSLLEKAEQIQSKNMQRELLLEIWIAKSECYKKQFKFSKAMMMLSRVINDDSASSLRVRAMFLRAEIYEAQHRRDLAIKQLEATAKKGGEWGILAAQKLEEIYGL